MANRKRAEVRSAVHRRIRRKVRGSTERPRLAVYRSLNHIYAQVIDDEKSQTLASASTTEKDLRGPSGGNVAAAKRGGQAIAERALSAGIDRGVFDRGGVFFSRPGPGVSLSHRPARGDKKRNKPVRGT